MEPTVEGANDRKKKLCRHLCAHTHTCSYFALTGIHSRLSKNRLTQVNMSIHKRTNNRSRLSFTEDAKVLPNWLQVHSLMAGVWLTSSKKHNVPNQTTFLGGLSCHYATMVFVWPALYEGTQNNLQKQQTWPLLCALALSKVENDLVLSTWHPSSCKARDEAM